MDKDNPMYKKVLLAQRRNEATSTVKKTKKRSSPIQNRNIG